jgi:Laminin G domain
MKMIILIVALVCFFSVSNRVMADEILLEEAFTSELSADWFWGLGTWTAKDGILRGFESGERRHGPVKMRKFPFYDAILTCEFQLDRGAAFAGIIFNGSQERGHLVHLVMSEDTVRILAHPKKGETRELLKQSVSLKRGEWHKVEIRFAGSTFTATVDGQTYAATQECIAEEKLTFGLGGDSGGPEGEKAGALEFRSLRVVASSNF